MRLNPTIYVIYFTVTTIDTVYASAWLIPEGHYRYTTTLGIIDSNSRQLQYLRANLYIETYRILQYLQERIKLVNRSSALYNKLSHQIILLKHNAQKLAAYQESIFSTLLIEYGVNKKHNFGMQIFYKNNTFQRTSNINNFWSNNEMSLFYKINLFQNANYLLTIQPKLYLSHHSNCPSELLYELLLLAGMSKTIANFLIFAEQSFGFTKDINSPYKKQIYSITTTEGIKFASGIMLTSYSKYSIRTGYGNIYNQSLYTQLSVAKDIRFNSNRYSNFTALIGYFWDRSLINKSYKLSGLVFSIWLDI